MPPLGARSKASAARGGGRGRRGGDHGEPEKDESERWLVTYADMLTVMLALFIVLYAISALNQSKFKELKYSLAAVFGDGSIGVLDGSPAVNDATDDNRAIPPTVPQVPVTTPTEPAIPNLGGWIASQEDVNSGQQGDSGEDSSALSGATVPVNDSTSTLGQKIVTELDHFAEIKKEVDEHLAAAGMQGAAEYSVNKRGLVITIVTNALVFPGNSATLLPRGQKLLGAVAPAIKKVSNNIEVDGYTNQLKVPTDPYPSGWELSSARASSVVRYLESHGLDDGRELSAVGFSGQRPLVPPDDPDSVTRNRRVEIVVLSSLPSLVGEALENSAEQREGNTAAGSSTDGSETNDDDAQLAGSGDHAGDDPDADHGADAAPAARGVQAPSTRSLDPGNGEPK